MCTCWTKVKRMFSCKQKKKDAEKTEEKAQEKAVKRVEKSLEKTTEKTTEESRYSTRTPAESRNSGTDGETESAVKWVEKDQFTKVLIGQPIKGIKDPKDCLRKILEAERPDLVPVGCNLDDEELRLLDRHLLMKGELRGGICLRQGWKSSVFSQTEVGSGQAMRVVILYAKGRFGAVYMVKTAYGAGALKIPLRMYASKRMEHEIAMLSHLFKKSTDQADKMHKKIEEAHTKDEVDKKEEIQMDDAGKAVIEKEHRELNHLVGIIDHGMNGGTPYLIMPLHDASLGKLRQELTEPFRTFEIFHLGQEAIIGIKQCFSRGISHRDFKPTNLILNISKCSHWMLCDFGEACHLGESRSVSYPDCMTLPYMSLMAHQSLVTPVPATVWWDLESWFYYFLEFFVPLPWMGKEVEETQRMKVEFWRNLDRFLAENIDVRIVPEFVPIAKLIEARKADSDVHSQLTALLKVGYTKYVPENFKVEAFVWVQNRKNTAGPVQEAKKKAEEEPEKGAKAEVAKDEAPKDEVPKDEAPKDEAPKSPIKEKSPVKEKSQKKEKSPKSQKSQKSKKPEDQSLKGKSQKSQKDESQKSKKEKSQKSSKSQKSKKSTKD